MSTTKMQFDLREVAQVLEAWRLKPLFTRPLGGTANASLIVVTRSGQFVLRLRNPRYSDVAQLAYDHSVLHALERAKLPVPHVVRTPEGSRWMNFNNRIYELYRFIDAREADPTSLEEVTAAGAMLGRFHLATRNLKPRGEKVWPRYFDPALSLKRIGEAQKHLNSKTPGNLGDLTPEQVAATLELLKTQARRCCDRLPANLYASLPHTIVHGDWHPANLKFLDHKVAGIFDFDWLGYQPRLLDITDGLLFFGSIRKEALDGGDIWSLTQPFRVVWERLRAFREGYQPLVAMTGPELEALPDFMRQRCLYIRTDAMARKVAPEDRLRFLVTGIEGTLQWIDRSEKRLRSGKW